MSRKISTFMVCILLSVILTGNVWSRVSKEEAAKLGKELTPLGAEKAGNADGSIPEWQGGMKTTPPGWKAGDVVIDPFPEDKPLFTITPQNLDAYKDKLTEGQLAMFDAYQGSFKMNIYKTRRTAALSDYAYSAIYNNALNAQINPENYNISGWTISHPFPIPKNGLEAIYNHLFAHTPRDIEFTYSQVIADERGDFSLSRAKDVIFMPTKEEGAVPQSEAYLYYYQETLTPPRLAGQFLLVHAPVNKLEYKQRAWIYSAGQRRLRRAPQVAYDGPGPQADGLRTADDYAMFNGAPDRYNWVLKGKKEIYIPYNNYRSVDRKLKNKDLVRGGHLNQDHIRYELHRVWVVEANLKKGMRHIYKKRVLYLDEDSWLIALSELYDKREQLWRVGMSHLYYAYDAIPENYGFMYPGINVWHDLHARRYLGIFLMSEEKEPFNYSTKRTDLDFLPSELRGKAYK